MNVASLPPCPAALQWGACGTRGLWGIEFRKWFFFIILGRQNTGEDAQRIIKGSISSPSKLDIKGTKKSPKESMPINYATYYTTTKKSFQVLYIATGLNTSDTHLWAFEDSIRRTRLQ